MRRSRANRPLTEAYLQRELPKPDGQALSPQRRAWALRWHLLTLVAALALPLIGLAAGSVWREHQGERARAEEALRHRARAIAQALDREFGKAEAALVALASSAALARGDLSAFAAEAWGTAERLGGTINLVDPDGRFTFSTAWAAGEPGPELTKALFVTGVFASGRSEVSDLFQDPVRGQPIVAVAVPVFGRDPDGGRTVVQALVLGVPQARISALLREQSTAAVAGAFVAVDDRSGTIVARTSREDEFVGQLTFPEVVQRLAAEEEGIMHGVTTFEGEPSVFAFAHAPWSRYAVILGMPEAAFQAPLRAALLRICGVGAVLLAIGLLAAWLLSRRIITALHRLAQLPAQPAPATGVREVDELAHAMARASAERDAALARLRSVVETAAEGIVVADEAGRIVSANPAALRMFGYRAEEDLVGHDLGILMPPDQAARHPGYLAATRLGTAPRTVGMPGRELTARRADGSAFPLEASVGSFAADGARFFTAVLRDVTARIAAEEALRQSERRLSDLVATLDLGAAMARDLDGTIRFWSQGCARLYGWSVEEAVGQVAHDLLRTVFAVPLVEIEAALLREGEWSGDLVQRTRDGREITVAARKVLRRDADGKPAAVMESVADVTPLRRTQAELARLNRDLEARVREEVAAREAAQVRAAHAERMQALGQLAGGIAHDFNNVLQAVTGAAAMTERRAMDPEAVRRLARIAADAAERGASITRRLLAFARRGDLRAEALEATAVLEGLRDILMHTLGTTISVRVEAEPDLPPLLADKGQLETVLVNLATNARDAMPKGGLLVLSAVAEVVPEQSGHSAGLAAGRYLRLAVRDTGIGMDAATLARVTEPFFTTKPQGQGTGLGLAMARGFAEQSGGALRIESEPGQDTTVTLWLPQAEPGAVPAGPDAGRTKGEGECNPSNSDYRVLPVDDDPLVRELLAEQLAVAGFHVLPAECGAAAMALLAAGERIDLLVTDLSMPGLDGLAVIREAQGRIPGLPAVLLTGYAGDAAALTMSEVTNGPFALLRKPISGQALADRLAALLALRAA